MAGSTKAKNPKTVPSSGGAEKIVYERADEAKPPELSGWPYQRHLAGRSFSGREHGDTVRADILRRNLVAIGRPTCT